MVVLIYFPAKLSFECSIGPARLQPPKALADLSLFATIKCCLIYLCVSDLLWLNHSDTNYLHWSFIQFINVTLYWGNLGWASGQKLASETVICCYKTSSFRMTSLCYLWWGLVKWHDLWKMHLLVLKFWRKFSTIIQTSYPAFRPQQNAPLSSVCVCLLALWSSVNSANCLRSGKFLCHTDTLISESQMELHRGYIIYVKLLFLPGNPWICPHLHGTYKEMTSIKMKTAPDHSYFRPSYLSAIFVLRLVFSLLPPLFGYKEITVPMWRVWDMHGKFTLGIIHEVVGTAFMLMV